jgi:penicillin-insensitive murein endopeptidase
VHPAIKKAVCEASKDEKDRDWLSKVRPYWGHYYHFHIRMACPKGSAGCTGQPSVDDDNDGCGAELARWLKLIKPKPVVATPPAPKPATPAPERRYITMDQLPAECRTVLASGTEATPPAAATTAPSAKPPAPASPGKAAAKPAAEPKVPPKAAARPAAPAAAKPAAQKASAM